VPLEMNSDLRFPMGATTPLSDSAVGDFLGLARRITSTLDRQQIIETFKEYFCKASGEYYARSSSLSWAESDLERHASSASSDAPGFIAAFCDACEYLGAKDIAVPDHAHVNKLLEKHNVPFQIAGNTLRETVDYVSPPEPIAPQASVVARALSDAKALIGHANASSAIDRAHTALHGYLVDLCLKNGIETSQDISTSKAFKSLRVSHPALTPDGPRSADVTRVLQAFATSVDAFSTIRNNASMAHANELLDEPEATAVINAIYTIFRYIQDCLQRYEH
jgi:hypothetical protein